VLQRQNMPPAQVAKAMALFTAVFVVGQVIGLVLAGEVADRHGLGTSLWFGAGLPTVAVVLPWGMRRTRST